MRNLVIQEIKQLENNIEELSKHLKTVVNDWAQLVFYLHWNKMKTKYWQTVIAPEVILYVAKINNEVAGIVQLHLITKPNGIHRAEICKLMTHPTLDVTALDVHLCKKQRKEQSKKIGLS